MSDRIKACRICGNEQLEDVVSLGEMAMTGVFPRSADHDPPQEPLELVRCIADDGRPDACGLLQLAHAYDLTELYGDNYGYRSGLNGSMVRHLQRFVADLSARKELADGDVVLDIASNDGTTLRAWGEQLTRVGIDPTIKKFAHYYPDDIIRIPEFFSADRVLEATGGRKAKVITSIAMFYDLERPTEFVEQVRRVLAPDGLWLLEQSYMPTMLERGMYDTICHEHLEYYGMSQIQWIFERCGMKCLDVQLTDTNGGSFAILATHADSPQQYVSERAAELVQAERDAGLHTREPYDRFVEQMHASRQALQELVGDARRRGQTVAGYGASTKGNVILQLCGFGPDDIAAIAEINEDKYGCVTPGTHIPILPEPDVRAMKPDYMLVLPWHFRESIVPREQEYLAGGGQLLFPLPSLSVVRC